VVDGHAVLLGGHVGAGEPSGGLRQRLLGSGPVAGRHCRLSRAELSGGAVHLGQHDVELRAIGVRCRLAAGLTDKSRELVGVHAGLPLRIDIRQLPVHFGTESDELPDKCLLNLTLVGCGSPAAARAAAGKKDEHRAHDPNPPHGSSFRSAALYTPGQLQLAAGQLLTIRRGPESRQ
jgi:hypothetical protein